MTYVNGKDLMGAEQRSNPFNTWRQAAGVTTTELYDRNGRPLQSGDVVHLIGKLDIMWKVVHVRPVLDKDAPPGLVELALQAVVVQGLPGGQPIPMIIKVRDAGEFVHVATPDPPPTP